MIGAWQERERTYYPKEHGHNVGRAVINTLGCVVIALISIWALLRRIHSPNQKSAFQQEGVKGVTFWFICLLVSFIAHFLFIFVHIGLWVASSIRRIFD